jgi:non-homologous end joining protein Ku
VHTAPHEQEMAQMLVDPLSSEAFDPAAYRDEYREKLQERIDAAGRPFARSAVVAAW